MLCACRSTPAKLSSWAATDDAVASAAFETAAAEQLAKVRADRALSNRLQRETVIAQLRTSGEWSSTLDRSQWPTNAATITPALAISAVQMTSSSNSTNSEPGEAPSPPSRSSPTARSPLARMSANDAATWLPRGKATRQHKIQKTRSKDRVRGSLSTAGSIQ